MAVKKKSKARDELAEVEARMKERYEWAMKIKQLQDESMQVVINRMVAVMQRMAPPRLSEREREIQYHSFVWIAVRLLIACAEWEIKVGNFKLPKQQCARCGKKVK